MEMNTSSSELFDRFENVLFQEIGTLTYLNTYVLFIAPGKIKEEISSLLASTKLVIDEEIIKFYEQIACLQIDWEFNPNSEAALTLNSLEEEDSIAGKANIVTLEELIAEYERKVSDPSSASTEIQYICFDAASNEMEVCLRVEKKSIANKLYLRSAYFKEVIDLKMGILKYINLLFHTKGFEYWQYAYIYRDSEAYEKLVHYVPQLFPDTLFSLSD
jgi:hypothetical protein